MTEGKNTMIRQGDMGEISIEQEILYSGNVRIAGDYDTTLWNSGPIVPETPKDQLDVMDARVKLLQQDVITLLGWIRSIAMSGFSNGWAREIAKRALSDFEKKDFTFCPPEVLRAVNCIDHRGHDLLPAPKDTPGARPYCRRCGVATSAIASEEVVRLRAIYEEAFGGLKEEGN